MSDAAADDFMAHFPYLLTAHHHHLFACALHLHALLDGVHCHLRNDLVHGLSLDVRDRLNQLSTVATTLATSATVTPVDKSAPAGHHEDARTHGGNCYENSIAIGHRCPVTVDGRNP